MRTFLVLAVSILFFPLFLFSQEFRPPSVPLVTHDPYFSIWSPADKLTDAETVHWTGIANPMHSMISVDGKAYRLMGSKPSSIEPLKQLSLKVMPTTTIYQFGNDDILVELSFTSPLLVKDPDILSRPVTFVKWDISSNDGNAHDVRLYFDCGSEMSVNTTDQTVTWEKLTFGGLKAVKTGTSEQKYLNKSGDNVRIDWGYAYMAVPETSGNSVSVAYRNELHNAFISKGELSASEEYSSPKQVKDGFISMAALWNPGETKNFSVVAMVAYDDIYSIRYFHDDLKAWWRREGRTFEEMLKTSFDDHSKLMAECRSFDAEITKDLETAGGKHYATMCGLIYRQCLAAHKLVADTKGNPLFFSKENFSNGCMGTVDVIYPFSPFTLLFSPVLTEAMLRPVLDYASSERWKFPFAPHDLGKYPYATGQRYGGGEKDETNQMPVEETGNMLIMLAAHAKVKGNSNFSKQYWPVIEKWADYLISKGFDPENQLCTDDFAGHLAHNVNLSAKAIVAIACYSELCKLAGYKDKASHSRKLAENMAGEWLRLAREGDHTLLAYDQKSTWSQKYNLVWDKLLDLGLFPEELFLNEIKFYKTKQAEFGLPLDSRERYTKNDWITWSATLTDNKDDFMTLFNPVYQFAHRTPDRVPVSDWYIVDNAFKVGFQARSVVGGYYIRMLGEKQLWKKWVEKK